ncbi:hypothetical protein [Microbacterium sp. NPDC076895]|uniref:hypothetical protein n=1 Tax=Microbacterium sp. NPDC076895 TaxID=3154957 RepID=UPI003437E9E7
MNYEYQHQPESTETRPEPQPDYELVANRLQTATSRAAARRIRTLWEQHGTPVAAFFEMDGVDPSSETLEQDFTASYVTSYADQEDLIDGEIASWGWVTELRQAIQNYDPVLQDITVFDRDAIVSFLYGHYLITEMGGALHVFNRDY